VTRATLIAEAARLGYEVREGVFPLEHMATSEEAFTSSSVREVMPVIELDGKPLGAGSPGEVARELQTRLRACASSP
jgi:branched-subunit amino acid aminotransferase/4-amino-4-deoxychorismate lyase